MKHLKSFKLFESNDYLPMEGTDIWHDLHDIDKKDENEEYSIFEIEFEIPVDMINESYNIFMDSYEMDNIKNNIKDIFIDLSDEEDGQWFETSVTDFKRDKGEIVFNAMLKKLNKFQESYLYKSSFDKSPCPNITEIIHVRTTLEDENAPSGVILDFTYYSIREDVERCIEYMESNGWWYTLEPVWERSSGLIYNPNTAGNFGDQYLQSMNILFYK